MRIITVNPEKCVGCLNCVYECAFTQNRDFDVRDANIRISYHSRERVCIPVTCAQCNEAWCLEICPSGAVTRNAGTGAVEIDPDLCAGCKMCMLACPFGNVHFSARERVSAKCNLCGGDPKCVRHCVSGALQFEDEAQAYQYKKDRIDNRLKHIFKKC